MSQFETWVKLNVLLLGSYDVPIGMDWMEKHQVIISCFQKTFTCLNNKGERIIVIGIPRKIYVRQLSALQMKKVVRKGCKVFFVHVINNEQVDKEDKLKFDDIPILQYFLDVFTEEIPGLPPKRDLDFTIELVPGEVLNSKPPYRMDILGQKQIKITITRINRQKLCKTKCIPLGSTSPFLLKRKMVLCFYVSSTINLIK